MTEAFTVEFQPSGMKTTDSGRASLLHLARSLGLSLESTCGGLGTCRTCAVRIEGAISPPTAQESAGFTPEEIASGWRCACQTKATGACTVYIPAKSAGGQFSSGKEVEEGIVPIAEPIFTPAPQAGYWRRGERLVGPFPDGSPIGLAVDLGTTNVAAALVDLCTGHLLGSKTITNPQVVFGADVISRLGYALKGEAQRREIQRAAVAGIRELADSLTGGVSSRIAEVAVVGNTVMQHLLLGQSIESLSRAPYNPSVLEATEIAAADLGLCFAPDAVLYCAPNVAGFVGGDHLSALLDVAAKTPTGKWAMLDIGTNTEIALCVGGKISSVSCASGPAFEGGKLTCGMRASPGAIDRVVINDTVEISTIGGRPPTGICGSGVLSLVASLKRADIVDGRGRMKLGHRLVRERGSSREFVLRDDEDPAILPVVFTQNDVRAVQLAKAAIRAGLDILLSSAGLDASDLDRVLIAGAFGRFVNIEDAFLIGLLPGLPPDRVAQVGNSAGAGVCRLVACAGARREVAAMARQIRYLELALEPTFQKTFVARSFL